MSHPSDEPSSRKRGLGWGSVVGWILTTGYLIIFAAAYRDYLEHPVGWMADLGLNALAIPYILVGRVVTLDATFSVHGPQPWSLIPAVLFCASLVYGCGWLMERLARRVWTSARTGFKRNA